MYRNDLIRTFKKYSKTWDIIYTHARTHLHSTDADACMKRQGKNRTHSCLEARETTPQTHASNSPAIAKRDYELLLRAMSLISAITVLK